MRTSRARAALAALALVLAGTLAACGGDDDGQASDPEPATDSESSAEPDETGEPSDDTGEQPAGGGSGLTEDNFASTLVAAQSEAGTVHLNGSFGTGGQSLSMDGDLQTGEPAELGMDMQVEIPQVRTGVRMILVDQTVYMNLGRASGDKYVRIDLADPSDPLGQQFGPLLDVADPSANLAALDEGLEELEEVGSETIDGAAATRYRATVNTEEALAASGVSDTMPPQTAAQLPETFVYEVWVGDDDGLIRQLSFDLLGQASELTFSDWGEPVQIEAPPANEIVKDGPLGG